MQIKADTKHGSSKEKGSFGESRQHGDIGRQGGLTGHCVRSLLVTGVCLGEVVSVCRVKFEYDKDERRAT